MSGHLGNSSAPEGEILAGTYNVNQRRAEVNKRLEAAFAYIRSTDFRKELDNAAGSNRMGIGRGRGASKPEDVVTMSLSALEDDIDELGKRINAYISPHFTKEYRTCQGLCTNLQTNLDKLDVDGRDELRKKRKDALMKIEKLAKELASKPHSDGKSCDYCELKH